MLVRATVSSQGFNHRIDGKLRDTVEREASTGMILAQIPVLRLMALGSTENEAQARLHTAFAEFCDVEIEQGQVWHLLNTLINRGFYVFNPKTQPHVPPLDDANDFLTINVFRIAEHSHNPQTEYSAARELASA